MLSFLFAIALRTIRDEIFQVCIPFGNADVHSLSLNR